MYGLGATGTQPLGTRKEPETTIVGDDVSHSHSLEQVTISITFLLTVNDLSHDHRLEQINLTQLHNINPNDIQHDHRLEQGIIVLAIDEVQNPPSENKIARSEFGTNNVVATTSSMFTMKEKKFEYHGERWEGEMELIQLDPDEAPAWKAWLAVMEGMGRKFYMSPPYDTAQGNVSQNGTVGSVTRPRELTINGLSSNVSNIFKQGDYIQLKNTDQLLMILKDADSDNTGSVTVTVGPKIRKTPTASTTVETQNPQGLFQFDSNEQGWQESGNITEIDFSFVEVVHNE